MQDSQPNRLAEEAVPLAVPSGHNHHGACAFSQSLYSTPTYHTMLIELSDVFRVSSHTSPLRHPHSIHCEVVQLD
jgi:hypothetical protein